MDIVEFCDKNEIGYFPINLTIDDNKKKTLNPIKHQLYKGTDKKGNTTYKPKYTDFRDRPEIIKPRQELLKSNPNLFTHMWIDTTNVFQVDIDCENYDEVFEELALQSFYYPSLTKSYGLHIFMKSDFKPTTGKYSFNPQLSGDKADGVELLSGQGAYAPFHGLECGSNNKDKTIVYDNSNWLQNNLVGAKKEQTTDGHDEVVEIKEGLNDIEQLLECVTSRCGPAKNKEWTDVAQAIKNEYKDEGNKYFIQWTLQYGTDNKKKEAYDHITKHIKYTPKKDKSRLSIASLHYWAKKDNYTLYKSYFPDKKRDTEQQSYFQLCAKFNKGYAKIEELSMFAKLCGDDFVFYKKDNFKTSYEDIMYYEPEKDKNGVIIEYKKATFLDVWLKDPNKLRYRNVGMYPDNNKCPADILNLWKPFDMEKVKDYVKNEEAKTKILEHIKILCNHEKDVYDWFIKWIAQMIQYPDVKSVCPTLISEEGAGKGTLLLLMRKMLGNKKVVETTEPSRDVWGQYNPLMKSAFLVNLNEMSGKETIGAEGKIKGLVTDDTITISEKHKDVFTIPSYHRFIITTNNEESVRKRKGDRRNVIIRCSDELCIELAKTQEQKDKLINYHTEIHNLLSDTNVIKTMYEYFKNEVEDMVSFKLIPTPQTTHDKEQQEINRCPIDLFIENLTRENYDATEPVKIMSNDLYTQFNKYCEKYKINYDCNLIKFGLRLTRLKINGVGEATHSKKGKFRMFNIDELIKHYKMNFENEESDIETDLELDEE